MNTTVDVLIVGGGWSGLLAAARLHQAGVQNIRIIDEAGDFGGTWYWNRYPDARCDVESYIYLPLLEETGYIPTEKYVRGGEIRAHARRIGERFDLYDKALFHTRVAELRWHDQDLQWAVRSDHGDQIRARYVIISSGPLSRPKLPGIPGILNFKGRTFHTSRWDYSYTGGDEEGNLHNPADKRVALIGTGASGIQCAAPLAKSAQHVYVFQRTPSTIDVRQNRPTDPNWVKTLQPGWHKERMHNFHALVSGLPQEQDLVNDGWTDLMRELGASFKKMKGESEQMPPEMLEKVMEIVDFEKLEKLRSRVESEVKDKRTAEALKPWYRYFCKRPGFSDTYLQIFNRSNVTLVDTNGRGAESVTEKSVVVGGSEYEVDCIIFATGFEVGTSYTRRAGLEVYGRDGRTLSEHWSNGYKTLHGFYSHGFPNLFHMGLIQNVVSVNLLYCLEMQAEYIAEVVQHANLHRARCIEPTAEAGWVRAINEDNSNRQEFLKECTPGFFNNEGKPDPNKNLLGAVYEFDDFVEIVRKWRADGRKGLEISP